MVFHKNYAIIQYHLGNYYNWAAATATNDSSNNQRYVVDRSICPSGWTLPRDHDTQKDNYGTLWSQYGMSSNPVNGNNKLWRQPMYFNPSGYYDGTLHEISEKGYYTVPDVSGQYYAESAKFSKQNGNLYSSPRTITERYFGISIRCIARPVAMIMDKD